MPKKSTPKKSKKRSPANTGWSMRSTPMPLPLLAIPVDKIHPNPWNQKRAVDAEFQASIAKEGVIEPVLLRPHPKKWEQFEIVCGERRWEASKKAGLKAVPAIVRDLDDATARLHTFIENHHRAAMTMWQEAELLAEAAQRPGFTVSAAAAALGWTEIHVRRRMKLLDLSDEWKKFMRDETESDRQKWTAEMLELVACYPLSVQEGILERQWSFDDIADLKKHLGDQTRLLKLAPFPVSAANLCPAAGACDACPKRTGTQPDLFGDAKAVSGRNDKCLDAACWDEKVKAAIVQKRLEAKAEFGVEPIDILMDEKGYHPGALRVGSYVIVSRDDKDAVPAIVQDGVKRGELVFIRKVKTKKVAAGRDEMDDDEVDDDEPRSKRAETPEEQLKNIEARRWALTARKVSDLLKDENGCRDLAEHAGITFAQLAALAVAFGVEAHTEVAMNWGKHAEEGELHVDALLADANMAWKYFVDVVCFEVGDYLKGASFTVRGDTYPTLEAELRKTCALFGIGLDAIKAVADSELPVPPSLAAQGET